FFSGTHTSFDFGHFSQKEAISFSPDIQSNVFVSDEKLIVGPNLYLASTARVPGLVESKFPFKISLKEQSFEINEASQYNVLIIRDMAGRKVVETSFSYQISSEDLLLVNASYFIEIVTNNKSFAIKWIKTQ
ncbi:MAG: T9SS type A sorting domain-containing protein, partial [Bacteroidia bacterium]|nr:T9SS type A sorting domain-containing protein [Bacteroidia bacterium]